MSEKYKYLVQVTKYDDEGKQLAHEAYAYVEEPLLIAVENPDDKLVAEINDPTNYDWWCYLLNGAEYNIMTAEESY
jgi:hypothetical protein